MDKDISIQLLIADIKLAPVQIVEKGELCISSSMNMQSCTLSVNDRDEEIPITISYLRLVEGQQETFIVKNASLKREHSFAYSVGRILGGNRSIQVKVDVFFNKTEENDVCIGFLSQKYAPLKYNCGINSAVAHNKQSASFNKTDIGKSFTAKDVFLENYQEFGEILSMSHLRNDSENVIEWGMCIAKIPDSDILLKEFQKYSTNYSGWIGLLKSWGLKQDSCKLYHGSIVDKERYACQDGVIEDEKMYKVEAPCWTIWLEENGKRIEKLVSKGLIKSI